MSSDPFDNESLRRTIGLFRQIENDPAKQALRQLQVSSIVQAAEMLHQTDIQRLVAPLVKAQSSFQVYTSTPDWATVSAAISTARSVFSRPETLDELQRIDADLKHLVADLHNPVVPLDDQIQSFSVAAAQAVSPLQELFQRTETWQASLAERMAGLKSPWALEDHLGVSVVGFARIARLHDVSRGAAPFAPASQDVFAEELGEPVTFDENQSPEERESAQIDAGLNAEVVAFPQDAYPYVLQSAGFELRFSAVEPVRTEGGEVGQYDPQHAALLREIELRLRNLIEVEFCRIEGENWLRRRIQGDTLKRWQERKTLDHEQHGDSFSLIHYSDFGDLLHIIIGNKNWNEAFEKYFRSKKDFEVSMERLLPVRRSISHSRPLTRADQITLHAEGFRILTALGVSV